jgi:hypothetical protein
LRRRIVPATPEHSSVAIALFRRSTAKSKN